MDLNTGGVQRGRHSLHDERATSAVSVLTSLPPFGMEDPRISIAWADIAFGARVANGMFCDVFSCHLRFAADGLPIVVKMPRSELDSAELRSVAAHDVQKEIQVLRSMLPHEHVVPMLGFGTTPSDVPFVILPLLDSTLKAELPGSRESTSVWKRRSGVKRWPIERACTLGAQVRVTIEPAAYANLRRAVLRVAYLHHCVLSRGAPLAAFLDFSFFSSHPRSTTATTTRSQTLASSTATSNRPTWASCAPPTRSPSAWSSSTSASRLCSSSRARPTPVRRSGGGSRRAREAGGTWRPR